MQEAVDLAEQFTPEPWRRHRDGMHARFWAEMGALLGQQGKHDRAEEWYDRARAEMLDAMPYAASTRLLWLRLQLGEVTEADEAFARARLEAFRSRRNVPPYVLGDGLFKLAR